MFDSIADMTIHHISTSILDIGYEAHGDRSGAKAETIILLHGFPYAPVSFSTVAAALADQGHYVVIPWLRGFGPTRFRNSDIMRSGQQAAIAADVKDLMDALELDNAILAGFDWGGRAACAAAILWPGHVKALLAIGGMLVQDLRDPTRPAPPQIEHHAWHQYYLASERGKRTLQENPAGIARLLWEQWSPGLPFDETAFAASVAGFDNPDFAEVASHSYAHRIGAVAGDPIYDHLEQRLSSGSLIHCPTISLFGEKTPLKATNSSRFSRLIDTRTIADAGHNPATENPAGVIEAINDLIKSVRQGRTK